MHQESQKIKVLLIRFSSIGDIVLTSPVIRCIKKTLPDAELHFLSKKQNGILLVNNPFIDKVIFLEDTPLKSIKVHNYDYIIDLHNNLRTLKLKIYTFFSKTKWYHFNKINLLKWLTVVFKAKGLLPNKHIVFRYLDAAKPLGIKYDNQGLDFFITQENKVDIVLHFENITPYHYYVYVIGGQHNTKKLPYNQQIKMLKKLKMPVILMGGIEDMEQADKLKKSLPRLYNACGKFNLQQSASIIEQSRKVFTHDTGLMHIAAALLKPIISIWGNTIPEFGMYPFYPAGFNDYENKVLEVKVYCRPCSKIGFNNCPYGHFKCMQNQNFNDLN